MKLSTFKKAFGAKVQKYRIQKDLTQSELAEKLGIETASVGKIECGVNFVSAKNLLKLCTILEVNPASLFAFGSKIKIDKELNHQLEEILGLLFQCDDEQLIYIYKLLDSLLKIPK